jgi:hypothetical protein
VRISDKDRINGLKTISRALLAGNGYDANIAHLFAIALGELDIDLLGNELYALACAANAKDLNILVSQDSFNPTIADLIISRTDFDTHVFTDDELALLAGAAQYNLSKIAEKVTYAMHNTANAIIARPGFGAAHFSDTALAALVGATDIADNLNALARHVTGHMTAHAIINHHSFSNHVFSDDELSGLVTATDVARNPLDLNKVAAKVTANTLGTLHRIVGHDNFRNHVFSDDELASLVGAGSIMVNLSTWVSKLTAAMPKTAHAIISHAGFNGNDFTADESARLFVATDAPYLDDLDIIFSKIFSNVPAAHADFYLRSMARELVAGKGVAALMIMEHPEFNNVAFTEDELYALAQASGFDANAFSRLPASEVPRNRPK